VTFGLMLETLQTHNQNRIIDYANTSRVHFYCCSGRGRHGDRRTKNGRGLVSGKSWAARTPAQVGLIKAKLDTFKAATGNRAGVVIRDGFLVYKWGSIAGKFDWASAAKPLISTMLFFAVEEGRLSGVDDFVSLAGWDLTEEDQELRFSDLANMISGYALPEAPGEAWGYNDVAISLYNKSLFTNIFGQKPDPAVRASSRLGRCNSRTVSCTAARAEASLS
jgi:hypothetical protein